MSSSDEGEIIEDRVEDSKASPLPRTEGSSVNRRDRIDSRRSSADGDSASRYGASSRHSRSPRGHKRGHDDYAARPRRRDEPPRSRSDYDDANRDGHKRSRVSYDDLDNYDSRSDRDRDSRPRRDRSRDRDRYNDYDRDRHQARPPRQRSRSPYRSPNGHRHDGDRRPRDSSRERQPRGGLDYEDRHDRATASSGSRRSNGEPASRTANGVAKTSQDSRNTGSMTGSRVDEREHAKAPAPEQQDDFVEPEEFDEEAEIERRRKRREELLAKSSSATPLLLHAVGASEKVRGASPASFARSGTPEHTESEAETPQTPRSNLASPRSPGSQDPMTPSRVDLADDNALMNTHGQGAADDEDGPSAADYDPTHDMKEDERRDELRHGQTVIHGEAVVLESTEKPTAESAEDNLPAKKAGGDDDDDFDMFAEDFDEEKYATKPTEAADGDDVADAAKGGILEGDDKDGYYKIRIGEVLNGRYQIQSTLGRGMFSGVIRALDTTTKECVAIKMMRNNDALRKGGYTEIAILQKLNDADPENRKHIIKFERSFDYRGHLCMVFENLSMNLREVLRKFGNNVGINLGATRTYAYQMFVSLAHMRKCSIIHADVKPDNILVNESRNVLKMCDLGTAIDRSDAATAQTGIAPYLVSRFYRAPEIILGMPYDYGVDMWSIGCTLYELYTGKILFTGDSNNQMLKAIMEIRGRLTPKLYKRGQLAASHFDDLGQFVSVERDKVLGKTAVRTLPVVKPTRDLRTRLLAASSGMNEVEMKDLHHFIDLLEQCLALNPDKRIKPTDALKHPFFTSRSTARRRCPSLVMTSTGVTQRVLGGTRNRTKATPLTKFSQLDMTDLVNVDSMDDQLVALQASLALQDFKTLAPVFHDLDKFLAMRTYLSGYNLSAADRAAWNTLYNNKVALGLIRRSIYQNVTRWFTHLETAHPEMAAEAKWTTNQPTLSTAGNRYNIHLQDTENGVVTRFPPEPSGYLHIGHAKAALLNDYFAHDAYSGSLILRFDDTNPAKITQEYEDSIPQDIKLLGIKVQRVSYTSDYFEQLYKLCEQLISDGNAYAEDTDPTAQAKDRRDRLPSKCRDRPAAESLAIFKEMRDGTDFGRKHCIRARITYNSSNGSMRDPIVYRFPKLAADGTTPAHHRTGHTWHIYPTYDFACPLVDSIEGVTHALRTTEYSDRNEQYYWFHSALNLRKVYLWDFARINFIRTFLSKRKLARVVETGRVTGWDDPRMPTVRGILRRGLTVQALREFMLKQGPSRNAVTMDWTILWAMNKKLIDPAATRHTAVEEKGIVLAAVAGGPGVPFEELRPKHPKNTSLGTKAVSFSNSIYIDQADAASLTPGEEVTLMSWGNALVRDVTKSESGVVTELHMDLNLDGDVSKTDKKIHWLSATGSKLVPAELWEFGYLLTKDVLEKTDDFNDYLNDDTAAMVDALLDSNCADLRQGDIIQLERKGYYRVDRAGAGAGGKMVLFKIPTGGAR